jgi:hypothetical protein
MGVGSNRKSAHQPRRRQGGNLRYNDSIVSLFTLLPCDTSHKLPAWAGAWPVLTPLEGPAFRCFLKALIDNNAGKTHTLQQCD